jgi:glycosyltransferase involved in cell wall biosynthesis
MSKVLINGLLLNDQFAGVQYYIENLFNAFSSTNKSLDVDILLTKNYKGNIKTNDISKIDIAGRSQRIIFENLMLPKYYKQANYQLYHSPGYILPYFWKYPSVVTIHDLIALNYPEFCQTESTFYFKFFLPHSIKKATQIIAVSNKVKEDILNQFNILPDRINVIYHGINKCFKKIHSENELSRVRLKYNLSERFILFVGNIEPKKNLLRLIKAFYQLKKHSEFKHKLIIVGKNGWKYNSVYNTIEKLRISDEIKFTGYVEEGDLPAIYSLADAFVFPSMYEGFGIPPLEAMACETPVLVSKQGALIETTGGRCLQVDAYNIDDIAKGINTLLTDENLRKRTIEDGKKWIKPFTWERAADLTMKVYEKILAG